MKSYKGQLSPGMSFTMSYRKSILLVGPARASSYFQRIEQETSSSPVPWKKPLKRSSKTQLSITSKNPIIKLNSYTQNVHNNPPQKRDYRRCLHSKTLSQKIISKKQRRASDRVSLRISAHLDYHNPPKESSITRPEGTGS